MGSTFRDKMLGVLLTALGLGFIGWQHPNGATLMLAGFVTLGGLAAVISAQLLAALVKQFESAAAGGSSPNGGGSSGSPGSGQSSGSSSDVTVDQAR